MPRPLLHVLILLALSITAACEGQVPLSSSVLLLDARRLDQAETYIDRAASMGGARVQLVVTLHARLSSDLRVKQLGLMRDRRQSWSEPSNFIPLDNALRQRLQSQFEKAVARAVHHRLDIAILPHLDPAGSIEQWRNYYRFGPFENIGGYSYFNSLIVPVAAALNKHAMPGTRIWFSLAGEMGRSVFEHPLEYRRLAAEVRRQIHSDRLQVGVSFNHNELGGGHRLAAAERATLQRLLNDCDFVGFSNYRPFTPPATPATFAKSCEAFAAQLSQQELTLPDATRLHFSEIGLGGAPQPGGRVSPQLAAQQPWEGVSQGKLNPWRNPSMRSFRRQYYAALIDFLANSESANRPVAAFLWNEGSWAPLGIDQPRLADPAIVSAVRMHNTEVQPAESGGY